MSKKKRSTTLGLVVRVSKVGDREGESYQTVTDQVAIATAHAIREGYDVNVFDADQNVSGATPFTERPGMGAALKAVAAGKLAGIVVSAQDRLLRPDPENGVTLKAIQQLIQKAGGVLLVADSRDAELLDPEHELPMGNARSGTAYRETQDSIQREEMAKRWKRARKNAIARGVKTGPVPAGYSRSVIGTKKSGAPEYGPLVPNEDAPAIQEAFHLRAKQRTNWHDLARFLTAKGVTTARGGSEWTASAAMRLIQCRVYRGEIRSGKEFVNTEAHEALVDEITFRRAGRKTPNPSYVRGDGPLLGGGLVRCGTCRSAMVKGESKGWTHLRCSGGPKCKRMVTIGLHLIEPFLIEQAFSRLGTLYTPALEESAEVAEAEARLCVIEDEFAATDADEEAGELSPREAGRVRTTLEREKDALEAMVSEQTTSSGEWTTMSAETVRDMLFENVAGQDVLGDDLPEKLVARHVPTARQFLRDVLGTVTVKPGRGAVEERVSIGGGALAEEVAA